jgi:hypothetical protein
MHDGSHSLGRAERRRIERRRRRGLRGFHDAAGGAIELHLVRAEATPALLLAGGPVARAFAAAAANFHDNLDAQQCLICGRNFGPTEWPIDWTLGLPLSDPAARRGMISGICIACSDAHPDDRAMVLAAVDVLRRGIWPGLREIDAARLPPTGGRA